MERVLIGSTSEVLIGPGLADLEPLLPSNDHRRRVAVLAQPASAGRGRSLARRLVRSGLAAEVRVLPDGEAAKDLRVAASVYEWLTELGFTRFDTVVGMGGGSLTDLAGFVAATYLRGVEVVHVPTTLVGAVDAAIGGKTGVNLRGKNLVGAFWHPSRVLVDTTLLNELTVELRRQGLAEALKAGMVGDPELVDLLEETGLAAPLEQVVPRAVRVKAAVVAEDLREEGRRSILNYGHTVGHAVEVAGGLTHGQAVALGMVAAGRASADWLGFSSASRQEAIIEALGLPIEIEGLDRDRVSALLELDKKRTADGLRMVLLRAIGRPEVRSVDAATVMAALAAIGVR